MNNAKDTKTKANNSNKNAKTSVIDLVVEMKVRSLVMLWIRARLIQTALKKYDTGVALPGEIERIVYNDNILLNEFSEARDRRRKILDIDTDKGQKELEKAFEIMRSFKIDIHKKECFDHLLKAIACWGRYIYKNMPQEYFLLFTKIDDDIRSLSCEAIGYWTAKLERAITNQTNVSKRTNEKETNKKILKDWLSKIIDLKDKKEVKALRLRAMDKFGKTERTILKWMQEIKEESTLMRKKDEPA